MKLLLTGFEPFGGSSVNPSEKVIQKICSPNPNISLVTVLLPVDRMNGPAKLLDSLQTHRPDAVICLGEASGRAVVSIERVAINLLDFRIPDNSGSQVFDETVILDGPAAYFVTLPVRSMLKSMQQKGIPVELSLSAGAYLCNQILYHLLHHLAQQEILIPAGFIHLPALPEQAAAKSITTPSMSLETSLCAVQTAIETVAQLST